MKRILATAAAILLGSAAFVPTQALAQVGFNIVIGNAPPPPRYEVVPPPRYGYVWAPGYWDWNGRRHQWMEGHWERARPGYTYQRPEWRQERDGWRLAHGGWQRAPEYGRRPQNYREHGQGYGHGHGRGDKDRDGVPNYADRDRDGDGVANRYDRRPDNPRRD